MLDVASLATRLIRLAAAAFLVPALVLGCNRDDVQTAGFDWPSDTACPPPDEAPFYFTSFAGPGDCGWQLLAVDSPGVHTPEGCAYLVTTETFEGCGFGE